MKEITNLMIHKYNILELGIDFMGFSLQEKEKLTYDHLIVPRRLKGKETIQNGAILIEISHNYLHVIESYDLEIFNLITSEMIDENINKIDLEHIKRIDSLLLFFEMEHRNHTTRKGKPIIKDEYIEKRYLRRLK